MSGHFMKCFWIDRQCCFSCRISGYIAWNSYYLLGSGIRSPYIFRNLVLYFWSSFVDHSKSIEFWNLHHLIWWIPTYSRQLSSSSKATDLERQIGFLIFFFFHPLSTLETEMGIFKQILQGNLEFESEPWNHLALCYVSCPRNEKNMKLFWHG